MQWSPDDTANEKRAVRQVLTTFKTTWLLRYGDTCIAIDRVGFVRHNTTDITPSTTAPKQSAQELNLHTHVHVHSILV